MKLIIFLFLLNVVASTVLFSQDTVVVYFDKDWNEISNKDIAVFYGHEFPGSDKRWHVQDFYLNNQIQMSGSYKSKKRKVRQGEFTFYHENGNIESNGYYVKNKVEGEWISWYKNGEMESKGVYTKGLRTGVWTYFYDNGHKQREGNFNSGFADGTWIYWHETGEKKAEGLFRKDKKEMIWQYWFPNGKLQSVETFINGVMSSIIVYFENGNIRVQGNYVNGVSQNEWRYWNVDGWLAFKGNFKNGYKDGEWVRYFPEGEMKILYKNGEQQGEPLGGVVIAE